MSMAMCRPGGVTYLSKREAQIARLYVDGRSHKEIARALGIAPATVRTHLTTVYRKLDVTNRIELLRCFWAGLPPAAQPRPVPAHGPRSVAVDGDMLAGLALSTAIEGLLRQVALNRCPPAVIPRAINDALVPARSDDECKANLTSDAMVASIERAGRLTLENMSGLLETYQETIRAEIDRFDPGVVILPGDGLAEGAATEFVTIDGKRIAYRSVGEGQPGDVPIVFLHRFRASVDDWDPALINAVAGDRRVILFDNVGVGESDGQTPESLEQMADDAASFARALGLTGVDILGWSMGGMTAQILAAKHPDLVRRLALIATLPPGGSPEVVVVQDDWEKVARKPTYTDEDLLYLFFSPSPEGVAAGLASIERTSFRRGACEIKTGPETMQAQYRAAVSFFRNEGDWFEKLKSIEAPTLVAGGDNDPTFPTIDSVVLAREIPQTQLAIYPDAGHGFHFQYPDRFAADLRAFLRR